ncbi:PREDICTED: CKLF-like MARVEL transmembrane domain-containing protein 4 [Rhagoletis zephyria]|uniref:CKLF-like MARVEL transmembrane domain-containing protein 4 n=1 Tax=Rhagoletis zephyria TaxID=28612 RepID=UPI0008114E34|nr:PREDICTED: CKLF-like MARVEL transmembrane domain-containing protein 4 [Rhagoletis zephyria]XP_017478597.1 PREDICTED: CKLF-like MARVEL transmembrane domain-containing protein 4 [Rhagoletis zephyria]XP_017478598.1 PREDICTED: CKLF-like MARVEL transmembrane domain-containing protein 4 [Rhagoletis zephyria]XP_017478599.1 PREDICTED: CKLF-like MARVEL transmembrane domain-containing protein 4 [Rhagoletis zephyria]XP_017478600.1 PREDICTED: CKLF-like MARVEL transmembrane domain-containing protein 4 [R
MVETVVTVERNTTTQTTAPSGGGGLSALKINIGYFTTVPGILKLVQFVLGIICMACGSPAYIAATSFFLFVVVISFIATILWIFAYLLGIREALNVAVNWIFTELLNTAICALLYFIAFVVQLAKWSGYPSTWAYGSNIAAGVFGCFNFLAYAAGAYFLYLTHKSGANY